MVRTGLGSLNPSKVHLLITSSRRPARTVRTLMRDLQAVVPNSLRLNRGKTGLGELGEIASAIGAGYVLLIGRWKGCPGLLEFYKVEGEALRRIPPLLRLGAVRLRREIKGGKRSSSHPESVVIIEPRILGHHKLAEALGEIFGMHVVPQKREPQDCQLYMTVKGKGEEVGITFFSAKEGSEVGPVISVADIEWEVV